MFCSACGTPNPDTSRFCNRCGAALAAPSSVGTGAAAAAPAPARSPAAAPGAPHLGSLLHRAVAALCDALLIIVAAMPPFISAARRWGTITDSGASMDGLPGLVAMFAGLCWALLYYIVFEGVLGATPGKFMLGLRVRGPDGQRAGFAPIAVRNLLRIIDGFAMYLVGLLVAALSKQRQRIGDHVAKTIVVDAGPGKAARVIWLVLWLAALGAGLWQTAVTHRAARAGPTTITAAGDTAAAPGSVVLTSGDLRLQFSWLQGRNGPPRPAAPYKPGDHIFSDFEITGYTTDPSGQVNVTLNIVPLDPAGIALQPLWTDSVRQPVASNAPITGHYSFPLPAFVPAGTYKLVIKAHDAVKNTEAEFAPTFVVERATPVAPAAALEVRNFVFSAAEDGVALQPAAYRQGQTVHYRFELAGMTFAGDRTNVHIAFQLLSPEGEVLMDKPEWVRVDEQFSYHPPTLFVPISGYLNLPSGAGAGAYTERFTVLDNNSNSTLTHEAKFEVQ